jgi:DNA-binding MarR family transcriptional regulator
MKQKIPERRIFSAALAHGLNRLNATIFSTIAHWEQYPGGVNVAGETLRYRTANEIADDTGYSVRAISRAVADLRTQQLIETRTIWDPRFAGRRVNGYRLTENGSALLNSAIDEWTKKPSRKRQTDVPGTANSSISEVPAEPVRGRQRGQFKYSEQDQETNKRQDSLSSHAGKRFYQHLELKKEQEEGVFLAFQEYIDQKSRGQEKGLPALFWEGLKEACGAMLGITIEDWTPMVGGRVQQFLQYFDNDKWEDFDPIEACMCAFWAYAKPDSFSDRIFDACGSTPKGQETHTYSLAIRGYVLANYVKREYRAAREKERWKSPRPTAFKCTSITHEKPAQLDLSKFPVSPEEDELFGETIGYMGNDAEDAF